MAGINPKRLDNLTKKGEKRSKASIEKGKATAKKNLEARRTAKLVAEELLAGGGMDTMLGGLYQRASQGDVKAVELILKLVGENPKEEKSLEISMPINEIKITSTLKDDDEVGEDDE